MRIKPESHKEKWKIKNEDNCDIADPYLGNQMRLAGIACR
jgi:hypothetical protein